MPRLPATPRAFGPIHRLRPPDDLPDDSPERQLFLEIVLANRADHFQPSDGVLLAAYVSACVLEQTASAALAAAGYVDGSGKPSGWLNVLTLATRTLSTYSRLLRLNPCARAPVKAEKQPQAISAYERMALEHRDEPEPN